MVTAHKLIEGLSKKNRNWIGIAETKRKINFIGVNPDEEIVSKEIIVDS